MSKEKAEKILMLMGHRGFIWGPSPEIYNPIAGAYELGPLGKQLKNNIEKHLRKKFRRNNFWEVQCPLIGPEKVWKASGHVERFFDYSIKCSNPKCGNLFRVDNMLEKMGYNLPDMSKEGLQSLITKEDIKCPACNESMGPIYTQNLMLTSKLGFPPEEFILRPETATTTYLLFPRLYEYFRTKMPMFVFQMGYAFRNEISPRKMLLRTREFEQCEGQIFITPDQEMNFEPYEDNKDKKLKLWTAKAQENNDKTQIEIKLSEAIEKGILGKPAYVWLLNLAYEMIENLGIPKKSIRIRQHKTDERAHYAHDAWDLEIDSLAYGWTEVCGVHDRGDYDLGRHYEFSKRKKLLVPGKKKGEKQIPHILEVAFGITRLLFFTLEQGFRFEEQRNVLDLPIQITPVPFAVFPLMKKPKGLRTTAQEIYEDLIDNDIGAIMQVSGSIGKRYRRTEEVGVRYAYTIDHTTLEDGTLTIRNIEDMSQKRIHKDNIVEISNKLIRGVLKYADIKDLSPKE